MNKHTDTEFNEIKKQIKDIRSVMNISGSTFSLLYSAGHFRKFFTLSGVFSLLFPLAYQILLFVYESQRQIPMPVMIAFYGCLFLCWCLLMIIRTRACIETAKKMDIKRSVWDIFRQVLSTKMWLAVIPVILLFIALPIKYASAFEPFAYVPYFGIVLGLVLNMIGVMIHEWEYSACGIWMILSGVAGLFLFAIPVHIAFAVILAPACFLFVIANSVIHQNSEHRNETL